MTLLAILFRIYMALLPEPEPQQPVTFANDVQPILERRCTPCHFPGGKMHAKLPFDKPETIVKLNTRLFSRIKKDEEQKVIRAFLAAPAATTASATRASRPE